uniref:Protein kinase domain-containing protein n=1 Tax=Rodentolepis nana TaxID=102285 RepID=A0A158QI27_RODNA
LNASDRDLAEGLPLIRDILNQTDNSSASSSVSSKLSHPPAAAALPQPPLSATADGMRMLNGGGMGIDMLDQNLDIKPSPSTFQTNTNGPPKLTTSASSRFQPASSVVSGASSTGSTSKRRSLKRPAQSSSNTNSNNSNNCVTAAKSIQDGVTVTTTMAQTVPLNLPSSTTSSALPDANVFLSMNSAKQVADHQQFPTHFTTQPATALIGCNHHHGGMRPLYAPQPIGPHTVQPPPPPAPLSGKSTPRQPAKKRLEARTPTIEELGVPSAFKALHDTPFTPVLGRSANSASGSLRDVSAPTSTAAVSSVSGGGSGEVKTKPEEDEDEEMNAIFAGPVARRHHSTINQPPIGNLVFADYKILHERLQQHVANGGLAALESPNALFFRTTPYGKRCASACALPSLSPSIGVGGGGVGGFADDLRQMPSLLPASPPSHTGIAGDSEGGSTHQIPPPPRLTPGFGVGFGGGRRSKPPLSTTPGPPGLFDRDTPGNLRNLASKIRDSPIFSTNPEILEVLVTLAQEYGVQSNRAGSSCSRPASQHYLRRNLFLGNDSPSPAGLPLNMLSTPVSDSAGGTDLIAPNNNSTSTTNPANQNQQQLLFDHNSPQAPPPQSDYNQ